MSMPKALGARLGSLHAAAFLTHGFYLPFFPLWLQSKTLTPAAIGVIMAIPIVVRVLVTAPMLSLTDRGVSARSLLVGFYLAQVIGYGLLALTTDGILIGLLVAAISVGQSVVIPANDLVTTLEIQKHRHLDYGRIRAFGSVAFLAASIVAGYLIGLFGIEVVVWSLALIPILGILATIAAIPKNDVIRAPDAASRGGPPKVRLSVALWIMMAGAALTQGSHGALNAFGSIYWQSAGFSDTVIGTFWAVGVVAEIGVFFWLGRFVGRGSGGLLLILLGSATAVLRFTIMASQPGLATTFVLQALHGLSFGASHLGAIAALTAMAPLQARGRAQGLYGSISALIMVASTVMSGAIYRAAGSMVFAAMVPLGVAGLVLTLVALRMERAQPQSGGSGG
ncbi:MFS transporter [Microvirga pudoricolor]|uniref:MFS transporter n=1 Tax=Microvirga pudoricolor TaxID=2778729 RepID=UPI00194F5E8E|nr:MFS transporter [Microvirga pudoricolor]MBM6594492.1 MFS transporter [Microvirga pudoricolor]